MEFFQEQTFTAFLAIVLTFILAKMVFFAVSNSNTDDNSVVCCINEGPVAKEVTLNRGLRVKSAKDNKRVKFFDDVVIRRVDRYEGSDNLELLDDVEEKSADEKERSREERVDQFGENGVNQDLGQKITEEKCLEKETDSDNMDGAFSENRKTSGTSGLKSGISDEMRIESDDDWEGIERSELEKVFAEAVNYLEYGGKGKDKEDDHNNTNKLVKLGSDVQMELYGLHKVAVEGPCHDPRPMPLKVSARAKWNAWQKLGSMSQDAAMEHYIRVLSDNIPDWINDYSADDRV